MSRGVEVLTMPRVEFKGATLGEVRHVVERWKHDDPRVTITKECHPVDFRYGGKHFLGKEESHGVVVGPMIMIDYEHADPDSTPATLAQTRI